MDRFGLIGHIHVSVQHISDYMWTDKSLLQVHNAILLQQRAGDLLHALPHDNTRHIVQQWLGYLSDSQIKDGLSKHMEQTCTNRQSSDT